MSFATSLSWTIQLFSLFKRYKFTPIPTMTPSDDFIYTRNLFIVFLVSLLLLILSGLFEYFFYIRKPFEGPIYKQKLTLFYRWKKWIAGFLIKLNKRAVTPDHLIDKLVIFNDKDKQVCFLGNERHSHSIYIPFSFTLIWCDSDYMELGIKCYSFQSHIHIELKINTKYWL